MSSWPPGRDGMGGTVMVGGGLSRRALVTVAVASALTAATVAVPVAFAAGRYSDVPDDSIYAQAVERLGAAGVLKGCGDGTAFCPQSNVTRGQLALLLDRMSGKGDLAPTVDAATVMGMTPDQLRGQTGPQGATGPAGPQGATGPAGPQGPHGIVAAHESVKTTPTELAGVTTILSLSLPAGDWLISSDVQLRLGQDASADVISTYCNLAKTGELIRETLAYQASFLPADAHGSHRLSISTTTSLEVPETIDLKCNAFTRPGESVSASGEGTNLTAIQLSSRTRTEQP